MLDSSPEHTRKPVFLWSTSISSAGKQSPWFRLSLRKGIGGQRQCPSRRPWDGTDAFFTPTPRDGHCRHTHTPGREHYELWARSGRLQKTPHFTVTPFSSSFAQARNYRSLSRPKAGLKQPSDSMGPQKQGCPQATRQEPSQAHKGQNHPPTPLSLLAFLGYWATEKHSSWSVSVGGSCKRTSCLWGGGGRGVGGSCEWSPCLRAWEGRGRVLWAVITSSWWAEQLCFSLPSVSALRNRHLLTVLE